MIATETKSLSSAPLDEDLDKMLGRSRSVWDELITRLERDHPGVTHEWHFSPTTGTRHVRMKKATRTILHLLPREKFFLTAFIFGERAEAVVRTGDFPFAVVQALDEAPACGAGRGIRLVTKNRRDVLVMLKLAAIKLAP